MSPPSSTKSPFDEKWTEFLAAPDARLARWLGPADGSLAIESWIDAQNNTSITDVFVQLDAPFADPNTFGQSLSKNFQERYAFLKDSFAARQLRTDWICPAAVNDEVGHRAIAWTCVSFIRHHAPALERLTVYLAPTSTTDPASLEKWLFQLISGNIPETIRFMVYDAAESPKLARLASADDTKVLTLSLPLTASDASGDDPAAAESLVGRHLGAMSSHAATKDLASVDREAKLAIALCKRHEWPHLGASVLMLLASAYLTADRTDLAIDAYGRAVHAAEAANKQGRPEGPSLIVQSRTAEATCLVKSEDYNRAAESYAVVGPLAEKNGNAMAAFESWRMLAYCKQNLGEYDAIWPAAGKAFLAAEGIDPEIRQSTLPYFGKSLLQAAGEDKHWSDKVQAKMIKLVGNDWEEKAK